MARILITGASKGLGRTTAIELAKRGHHVIATARNPSTLADLDVAQKLELDVTDDESVRRAVTAAGPVDVLVNNAAEIVVAPLETVPFDEVKRLYDINVFGTLRMVQAVAPGMRERRSGTIVNLSSVVGHMAFPLTGIYGSTKFAVEGLSEALRIELSHFGVKVLLIEPGRISTGALDAPRSYFPDGSAYLPLTKRPLSEGFMSTPEAVAGTIADAIESPDEKFRWPSGKDAETLLDARKKLDDAAFDKTLRSALGLTAW